ncbi:MAG: SCP2 sterol-binding domain-containing protein [Dokdonella sp.]
MSDAVIAGVSRTPNPVLSVFGRLLEGVLAHAISLDADTQQRLRALDGRAIQMTFKGTGLAMRVVADGGQLRIGPADNDSALSVTATPGTLLTMLLRRGDDTAMTPGAIDISGDAELARRMEQIASQFAPDIDEAFSRAFGDVVGFQLARQFRRALAWTQRSASDLATDSVEFLRDDSRDLVARAELDDFLDDVDRIRERGDRLDARVRRLLANSGSASK